ncbi:MAG TPA: hypothetical protein VFH11_05745 [Gemmatimonadota bacterium]|nr:hypothetical protein [Gemmatimonadota bacterium]
MISATNRWKTLAVVTVLAFGLGGCSQDGSIPVQPDDSGSLGPAAGKGKGESGGSQVLDPAAVIVSTNAALAAEDAPYRLSMIETITDNPDEAGITVVWKNVGNKQLAHDFVPGDPRRGVAGGGWSNDPNVITFAVDPFDGVTYNGVPASTTTAEILDAVGTWDAVSCSDPGLDQVASPVDLGVVAFLSNLGGSPFVVADIQFGGWQEVEYAGGTIAATHTFIWIDDEGNPTDIDGNGAIDVAFREIFFDAVCQACVPVTFWNWEIDDGIDEPGREIDIESITLHESGHGLSQAHFGTGFVRFDGVLYETSDAVMAAAYAGPRIDLAGADNGGHCSNWSSWPGI